MGLSGVSALEVQPFGGQAKFDFDASLVTFTRGMAKRGGAVFGAAPIVQGQWSGSGVPDSVKCPQGAAISTYFYANIDMYQGGGFLIWTPEQSTPDRSDSTNAYLWQHSSNQLLCYAYDADQYELTIGGQTQTIPATITAGTPEYLAWGFDTNNKLDGTNYAYFSRNDVQTFGLTTQPTAGVASSTLHIGSRQGTTRPANGIIEGLTFVREIPWTGTYGTDMGQGDIVAAHAAGNDVCLSIGSWGVTFCLPTNATTGALVTGTGEAWSHPHGDSLLTDSFCQTTYGSSAWTTLGVPSAGPTDITATERIFNWGYEWTSDAADQGVSQTKAGQAAGANYVLRVVAHCAQANDIRVVLWDNTNAAQIGANFDFGASSSRTAPGVALFCFELPTIARNGAGSDCVSVDVRIGSTAAGQTIRLHQCELYPNLVDNPSLETGAGNPWIPDGWLNGGVDAGECLLDGAVFHSGASSIISTAGWSGTEQIYSNQATLATGDYVSRGIWALVTSGAPRFDDAGSSSELQTGDTAESLLDTSGSWELNHEVLRCNSGGPRRCITLENEGAVCNYDDAWMVALDAVSLTVTPASQADSAESSGLRVDGRDACTQPITGLKATKGRIRWKWTPRHDAAQLNAFKELTSTWIASIYKDASNYLDVMANAANSLQLAVEVAGVLGTHNWNCSGAVVAGTTYDMEIRYTATKAELLVNGTVRATVTQAINFGANTPDTAYWGSGAGSTNQEDATFAAP